MIPSDTKHFEASLSLCLSKDRAMPVPKRPSHYRLVSELKLTNAMHEADDGLMSGSCIYPAACIVQNAVLSRLP